MEGFVMTVQDQDKETILSMLNKCVVFAASDMCEEGDLKEALKHFSLVEANEALSALDRIMEMLVVTQQMLASVQQTNEVLLKRLQLSSGCNG